MVPSVVPPRSLDLCGGLVPDAVDNDSAPPYRFDRWLAVSLPLPEYVYLETVTSVLVEENYLARRGFPPDTYDRRWFQSPCPVQIGWTRIERPVHSAVELAYVAADGLDRFVRYDRTKPVGEIPTALPQATSLAVCVIPVLDLEAAHDQIEGLLDALTLAHLLVSDTVRSVRLTTGIPLQDLTYRQLSPLVPALSGSEVAGTTTWNDPKMIVLQHSMDTLMVGDPLPEEAVEIAGHTFYQWSIGRPAAVVRDHVERAAAATAVGSYSQALTAYATACEVCLDLHLGAAMWETGMTPDAASNGWNNSITRRVKTRYSEHFGGNWDVDRSPPLAAWARDVTRPRNLIVHSGTTADMRQVEAARIATENLFSFLTERLVSRGETFPKTISLLLGRQSLEKYGGARTELLLSAHEEHNDKWERDFEEWRQAWLDLLWS